MTIDTHYMRQALRLARINTGRTGKNPSVGCVLVKDGAVIATATTAIGGRPHAEYIALERAGKDAKGATAYVTLEPCAHDGETPSCADLLIKAGISRVVYGTQDPDPRTAGQGIKKLEAAGIEARQIMHEQAEHCHAGFITRITQSRPHISVKIAHTLDGKIALANGESQWITGDIARRYVQYLRARHFAILTGIGTILADNSQLNVREDFTHPHQTKIILDTNLQTPPDAKILKGGNIIIVYKNDENGKAQDLRDSGATLINQDPHNLPAVLKTLADQGINEILVEAGATIATSFLKQNLCDTLYTIAAPSIMGGDARNMFDALEISDMHDILHMQCTQTRALGKDTLKIFKPERKEN